MSVLWVVRLQRTKKQKWRWIVFKVPWMEAKQFSTQCKKSCSTFYNQSKTYIPIALKNMFRFSFYTNSTGFRPVAMRLEADYLWLHYGTLYFESLFTWPQSQWMFGHTCWKLSLKWLWSSGWQNSWMSFPNRSLGQNTPQLSCLHFTEPRIMLDQPKHEVESSTEISSEWFQ